MGHTVTGVDLALPMVEHARRKAAIAGVAVRFEHGDARQLDLGDRFGLVYMTGNAFQAFLTRADQDALLASVREHLADDGLFTFGTRAPVAEHLETCREETEWNRYTAPDGREIIVSGYQRYDPDARLQHWTTFRSWRNADGRNEVKASRIAIRYTTADELASIARENGLTIRSVHGSWLGEPLAETSESLIFVCAKA